MHIFIYKRINVHQEHEARLEIYFNDITMHIKITVQFSLAKCAANLDFQMTLYFGSTQ